MSDATPEPNEVSPPLRCRACHGYVNRGDTKCPHCGSRDLPVLAGEVAIRGKHVVAAAVIHVALIAATYVLLGWSLGCAVGIMVLFFLFPKLVEAVARAWG
ncbi:MAG: hypothetical protein AAF328_06985 [Planctomycetota bacterium]